METISFARGAPAPELLPLGQLAECAQTVLAREGKTILSYGSGAGYTPLRELIGEWFGVHPGRVVITNGALQGLWLLARHLVVGQSVMVEWPTYDRAYKLLLQARAEILAAVVDDRGLDPDNVDSTLMGQMNPAFLYTIPTFQNPTGTTMPIERREHLVRSAMKRGFPLVEDDAYSLVRFEGEPLPALFDLAGKTSIYMSSFSTTIAPGLRVGWMILPEELADELTVAAAGTYITPSLLGQAVVCEFIRRDAFVPNLKRSNELLKIRRDAMLAALEKHFSGAEWTRPEGGYFVWIKLPMGIDMRDVLKRAKGVSAVDGTEFTAPANYMRLAYSSVAPDEIEAGVERLAAAV